MQLQSGNANAPVLVEGARREVFKFGATSEVATVVRLQLRAVLLLLSFAVLKPVAVQAQASPSAAGAIQGTVSITGATDQAAGAMQGTVSIAGETDQRPVSGATIAVFSEGCVGSTASDRQGKFSLSGLAPGIYLLEARYLTLRAEQKIRIDAGETVLIAVQLESPNPTYAEQ